MKKKCYQRPLHLITLGEMIETIEPKKKIRLFERRERDGESLKKIHIKQPLD